MEFRKLGNKTKMIKLMSNVGTYGLIILTQNWEGHEFKYIVSLVISLSHQGRRFTTFITHGS